MPNSWFTRLTISAVLIRESTPWTKALSSGAEFTCGAGIADGGVEPAGSPRAYGPAASAATAIPATTRRFNVRANRRNGLTTGSPPNGPLTRTWPQEADEGKLWQVEVAHQRAPRGSGPSRAHMSAAGRAPRRRESS